MFREALDEEEDMLLVVEDRLLNYTLLMETIWNVVRNAKGGNDLKRVNCPLCRKLRVVEKIEQRKCTREYFVMYCSKLETETTMKIINKSSQRGGPARLLGTDLNDHWEDLVANGLDSKSLKKDKLKCKNAEFGILLVSHTGVYFFEEDPSLWEARDKTEVEYNTMYE